MKPENKNAVYVGIAFTLMLISSARADDIIASIQQNKPSLATENLDWSFRLPKEDKVEYKGVSSFDMAGEGTGAMMYPGAFGAAGFLAAIVTHGLIVEGEKSHQKNKIQERADKVLSPYHAVLDNYTYQELMQAGLKLTTIPGNKKLIGLSEKPETQRIVESTPVFSLTQNQSAIIVQNVISIAKSDNPSTFVYQNTVKVISPTREESANADFWIDNQGKKLKEESARLLAYSLDLALNDYMNGSKDGNPQKTFRYLEGGAEKMERGELISDSCNRIVIKTLRGWLMSVPKKTGAESTSLPDTQCVDVLSVK